MARAKFPATDPLLAALIAKLPPADTDWPEQKQIGWLKLMAMAFAQIYGGDALAHFGIPATPSAPQQAKPAPPPAKPKPPQYPFIIDKDGYARNGRTNARISPDQATDMIADLRGMDGDMKTIVWADDSQGLNGRDLTIVAA